MAYELTISLAVKLAEDGGMAVGIYDPGQGGYKTCYMCSNGAFCCSNPKCCIPTFDAVKAGYVTFKIVVDGDEPVLIEPSDHRCPTRDVPLPDPLPGHLQIVPIPA